MAARTELSGGGQFHRRVEGAPDQDAADEAADRQKAQAEVHAGAADDVPVLDTSGLASACGTWHCTQK
ncbi:hypothetical protein G6F57_023089 [Rhizopus arrhizus]|nr:hypothetical protein G6F57_023089 [Rhizopus arrhizus]